MMKRLLAILLWVPLLVSILTGCGWTVPRPEIKTGEFDFSVTYELNGERNTVSGVYVCEYAGTEWTLDGGYSRAWNSYIKDGRDELMEIAATEDGGTIELHFGFYPEYFMGDPKWSWRGVPEPRLTVSHRNGKELAIQNEADVIEKTYGAKIISYDYSEPIVNSFGLFK